MKVYKDNDHCVTLRPFSLRGKRFLMVGVGRYIGLDPEGGIGRVRTEQDFWKEAPDVFAALGQAPVLDEGLPKPGGEVLVAGFCRAPGKKPVPALEVSFRVGQTGRRLAVFGDRERLPGGGLSDPIPFTALPLTWDRAFGGPDFPANPQGRGLGGGNKTAPQLPNVEDPENLVLLDGDRPEPACPFAVDPANPVRRALSGTYDKTWQATRLPSLPDDVDPEFFYSAQPAQRLAGQNASDAPPFFRGDEDVEIIGMSHAHPRISSRLPGARIRAFVTVTANFIPFSPARNTAAWAEQDSGKAALPYAKDLSEPGIFREVKLYADTVWLLPDIMGAFTLRRGLLPVEDDEMDDILRVFVVTENPPEEPHSPEYWLEEQKKRIRPVNIDLAPFAAAQAKTAKLVKKARDLPKLFDKLKKDMLGQNPAMPRSLGDIARSAAQTFSSGRATLDTLEKQVLDQREKFGHLMNFNDLLKMFAGRRAALDAQEKELGNALLQAREMLGKLAGETGKLHDSAVNMMREADLPPDAEDAAVQAKIGKLLGMPDNIAADGPPCLLPSGNAWHDRGFALLVTLERDLRRNEPLQSGLQSLGFERATLENIALGHSAEALEDTPEAWGLEAGPAFVLPPGFYVPRFAGRMLTALRIYPFVPTGDGEVVEMRGPGVANAEIVLVPGSDPAPLFLPAARPGGAVCVAPEDLSAYLAEQEAGDFCHIAVAPDPDGLGKIRDLPPLLPDVPVENGGLPLVVILPPGEAGRKLFAPWSAALPAAVPLYLPENCPSVLFLAERGHRLRRLLLDVLPPETSALHDFDIPMPSADGPPKTFTMNLPLPGREEIQGAIAGLLQEVVGRRLGTPVPGLDAVPQLGATLSDNFRKAGAPGQLMDMVEARIADALKSTPASRFPSVPSELPSVADALGKVKEITAAVKASLPSAMPPETRGKLLQSLALIEEKLSQNFAGAGGKADGADELPAAPDNTTAAVRASIAAAGLDPDILTPLTREQVQEMLAAGRSLKGRNLQGTDLSGLDFSGACLDHALCGKAIFHGCRMDGTDFTFAVAGEADFSGASFRGAVFRQTVLHKAVLRDADFTAARMELLTFNDCDAARAVFVGVDISLVTFNKCVLDGACFEQSALRLCAFIEGTAHATDFRRCRAFKCLFQKTDLAGALFQESALNECTFNGVPAAGVSFAGADLRKFAANMETDLSGADFTGANLREASLRLTRLPGAEFYRSDPENAVFTQCDLSHARMDGLRGAGCRFIKCDLTGTDISGTDLYGGALRKCRLDGADLTGANLFAVNLRGLVIDPDTRFDGTNLKRTLLDGKEKELLRQQRGKS
ncbi:MAG: DUF2169 domain-containing protein [Desulfovibrio sp.]|jgi:uncharacterized protein YjbI with pentapeptide repeats|nr:DUF2169 domain-containing protein [Desulfovibrio sp.]